MASSLRKSLIETALVRREELVGLASHLISIPSENPSGSQRGIVDFVKDYLQTSGIAVTEVGCNEEFPCLVATMGHSSGFHLALNGHLDVVPAGDLSQWDFDPFGGDVVDGKLRGRGASDMKSGVAGILFAARILSTAGIDIPGRLTLHLVSDEESGGEYGTRWLAQAGYLEGVDACLVTEPTTRRMVEIGQRGQCICTIKATGVSAHGSLANIRGDNAIVKLAKVLAGFDSLNGIAGRYEPEQEHAHESSRRMAAFKLGDARGADVVDHVSANVGLISGGTRPNMVPDYAEAVVDIRLPLNVGQDAIRNAVVSLIDQAGVEGVVADFYFKSEPNATDERESIVRIVQKNAEAVWGFEVTPAYQWASSDARTYRIAGIPTVQYGPSNSAGIHSYNEDVDVEDVVNAALVYIATICDLLGIE